MDKEQTDSLIQVIVMSLTVPPSPAPLQSEALGPLSLLQKTR